MENFIFYIKSMSILKSFKKSTNLDQAEISSLSRFKMTKDWSSAPIYLIAKESKFLCLTTRSYLFYIFCRMKESNEWYKIQGKNWSPKGNIWSAIPFALLWMIVSEWKENVNMYVELKLC